MSHVWQVRYYARDNAGNSGYQQADGTLYLNISDVNDEPPVIQLRGLQDVTVRNK